MISQMRVVVVPERLLHSVYSVVHIINSHNEVSSHCCSFQICNRAVPCLQLLAFAIQVNVKASVEP